MSAVQIAHIIKGLSEPARDIVIDIDRHADAPLTTAILIRKGLVDYRLKWFLFGRRVVTLTKLGRAVREKLLSWPGL